VPKCAKAIFNFFIQKLLLNQENNEKNHRDHAVIFTRIWKSRTVSNSCSSMKQQDITL